MATILVSALEHSANVHLKSLKKELSETTKFIGIFDNTLGEPIIDLRSLAIMGFVDALKKLRFFFKLNAQMLDLAKDADKILLIDSSGFNLPLAKKIKKKYPNKEIIYYILPQAWAWKPKRIPVLERTIDTLASILPFERNYYSPNAPITYVGHPLLDIIPKYKEEISSNVKHIAFMPGSRKGEIRKLMPIFKEVVKKLDLNATIIIPKHFTKEDINELYGNLSGFKTAHDTYETLYEADFAFICSGTATLEAALIGIPFVLSYIAKPLDYFIASRLVKLSHIGLSNIMFTQFNDRDLHPEFIQQEVTADNLIKAYKEYDRTTFLDDSKALRAYLKHGSSKNVAKILESNLGKKMKINFIDLKAQYKEYQTEIESEVLEVFSSAQFIGGEKLNKLENSLATYTGAKYAIGCSSGTDALLLSLMALDIGQGDEVITTPFTFIATAEVIAFLGAKSVFVDIDEETYNINPSLIEAAITDRTKAIIPVALYGQCADMDAINEIANKHEIPVIEDACQSFGASYNGKKSCNLSTIGCTSFFPSKPLGAYGDGGAIFTNNEEIAQKIRMLLNHGQNERYKHKFIGINGRLDAVQAAVLNVKLKHFDKEVEAREQIGARYSDLLEDVDVITPKIADTNVSVFAQYSIRVKDREAMIAKLSKKDIPTAVHYPVPLHLQEAFASLGYKKGDFPVSEEISTQIMSLPMSPYLSEVQQDFIIAAIKG